MASTRFPDFPISDASSFEHLKRYHVADSSDGFVSFYIIPDARSPGGKQYFFVDISGSGSRITFEQTPSIIQPFQVFILHFSDGTCQKYFISFHADTVHFFTEGDFSAFCMTEGSVIKNEVPEEGEALPSLRKDLRQKFFGLFQAFRFPFSGRS